MTNHQIIHNGPLNLGLSPCPNDTFMFYALLHGKVETPCEIIPHMHDVEELNRMVLSGNLDVSKVSYHLLGHVLESYLLLKAGSALGWGCGPLLVSRAKEARAHLERGPIAIPGEYTTAALLLRLYMPEASNLIPMYFARIPQAVAKGEVTAGVIIHESRFTYKNLGLHCIQDLGAWWEETARLPIPLGGIIAKRTIDSHVIIALDRAIRSSIEYAFEHRNETMQFVQAHAQETSTEVIDKHIELYVNEYSLNLGIKGIKAVKSLLDHGFQKGIFPNPFSMALSL